MFSNPRSKLHALEPLGTGEMVESLTSYFCRLAVSHSTSTTQLSRWICEHLDFMVAEDFDWHTRHISGVREAAQRWSAALSALTSIEQLDRLTFLPWRSVIAQNGLCIYRGGQFCPMCLFEDREHQAVPYLRLAWEPKLVTVCHKHSVRLEDSCHCCGKRNIRHASAFVVPGWCTSCGEFLGRQGHPQQLDSREIEYAQQVGQLIAAHQQACPLVDPQNLQDALQKIIDAMFGGSSASFAKGFGIPKTTIYGWMKGAAIPSLANSLHVAQQASMSVTDFLTNSTQSWSPTIRNTQLPLIDALPKKSRRTTRTIDWAVIEQELNNLANLDPPISVIAAAEKVGVDHRQLYLRCNAATRLLGERWKKDKEHRRQENVKAATVCLSDLADSLAADGRAITMREAVANVPRDVLNKVEGCWDVIRSVRQAHEINSDWIPANEERFAK